MWLSNVNKRHPDCDLYSYFDRDLKHINELLISRESARIYFHRKNSSEALEDKLRKFVCQTVYISVPHTTEKIGIVVCIICNRTNY